MAAAPTDNLVRAYVAADAMRVKDDDSSDGNLLFGHFAVFDRWTEIDSWFEGRFLERIAPGAFARTIKERDGQIRVLYDHGHDPTIGNKPVAAPEVIREDKIGAYYEARLFDTDYAQQLRPALETGQLGASFRFRVVAEEWAEPPKATKANPARLPERTLTDLELYEFGPVTFPAYDDASAGLRGRTDEWAAMLTEPAYVARLTERLGLATVEHILAAFPADGGNTHTTPREAPDGTDQDQRARRQWLASHIYGT